MSEITPPIKLLNRLRAASSLIPIIVSGLELSQLSRDKAALMAEFCTWSLSHVPEGNTEAQALAEDVRSGLGKVRCLLNLPESLATREANEAKDIYQR